MLNTIEYIVYHLKDANISAKKIIDLTISPEMVDHLIKIIKEKENEVSNLQFDLSETSKAYSKLLGEYDNLKKVCEEEGIEIK